ncbi:mechanosensitive ion channel family protein [uncultured Tateyamaria sp.]|uniref:mechanosensitive ion channel family protein n=1 Tax=uncultured Tateyamaria sp. TaxID=455651 RepID=UPI00261CBAAF|nr:mechanosensitive ion channel family protein [uncultured Tateyamaria sp.]
MIRALLVLLCLGAGPALAQNADQPQGTIQVEDSATQDAAIAVRIRDILGELDGYEEVTVTVSSGIVTLRGTTIDGPQAARLNDIVARVAGVVAIENEVAETTDVVARLNPAVERFRTRISQAVALLPLVAVALLAFLVVLFAGILLARMRYPWDRIAPNAFIANIYRQVVRMVFFVSGLVIALDILGATALLGTILGAAGIVGLAIGFAVRDTVENFIASIMLSIRQPFRPNDIVEIEGDLGKVIRLTSRATILLSFDGNHIRIPNATVFKSRIVNFSTHHERRFEFQIGVASDCDLASVRQLSEAVVEEQPFVLDEPAPMVWIDRIGDGAVILTVTGWIDQRETSLVRAKGEVLRLVKAAIEAAGVEVPDTTYRIQMLGASGTMQATITESDTRKPPEAEMLPTSTPDDVLDTSEAALDRLVEAERSDPEAPDLLSDDGAKE